MAGILRFEDIQAWQCARGLTSALYRLSNSGGFKHDYVLKDQIRGAAISVMSNIAEGFGRGGNKEFIQFLFIAKGSVTEIQAQLYVALDVGYINKKQFDEIYKLTDDTGNLIGGFIRYLKNTDLKGAKYNQLTKQT